MPNPSVRSYSTAANQTSSFSVTKPSGLQAGDLLLSFQYFNDNNSSSQAAHPTGFTLYSHQLNTSTCVTVSYKVATNSEPSSYSYSPGPGGNTSVYLLAIQDTDTNNIPDASVSVFGVGATANSGGTSTSFNNDLIVDVYAVAVASTFTPDASLTDLGTIASSSTVVMDAAYKTQAVAGPTSNNSASISGLGGGWIALTIALAPGAPPLPPPSRQPDQRWNALPDLDFRVWEHIRQSPYAQWYVPTAPSTHQSSQRIEPLPVLDSWWEQFRLQPVPVSYVPDRPPTHQGSQVIVVLADYWQEWSGYRQSPYAQWFKPPDPAPHTLQQPEPPVPDFSFWVGKYPAWPIPQGFSPPPTFPRALDQRWDALPDLNGQHYEQFLLQPIPSSFFISQEGVYGIAVFSGVMNREGAFRIQNQIEGWLLYLGLNGPPDLTQPPVMFSATLPFSVPLARPPIGTLWTYYVVVRRQDLYSLQSQNQYTISTVTIDSNGGLYMPPLPPPQSLSLFPRAGGNVIVQAIYQTANTDQFPATSWYIWADVVVPNPANPPTYTVGVTGKVLNKTIGPLAVGLWYVMVGLVRAADGATSPTIYSQVTIVDVPPEVIAVPSGFDVEP